MNEVIKIILSSPPQVVKVITPVAVNPSTPVKSVNGKTGIVALDYNDIPGVAPIASPDFSGIPKAPNAALGTNTTQIATTAFVRAEVAALIASSPSTLDTLKELADALGDDPNFATTVTTLIGLKAPIANPVFTGNVGIGIDPLYRLDVNGFSRFSGSNALLINGTGSAGHGALIITQTNGGYGIYDQSVRSYIQGKLGVGTDSPQAKVHANGALANPTTWQNGNFGQIHISNDTNGGVFNKITFGCSIGYADVCAGIGVFADNAGSTMYFGTSNSYPSITNAAIKISPSALVTITNTVANSKSLEILAGTSVINFGDSTQYAGYGVIHFSAIRTNTNWAVFSDGASQTGLNGVGRLDLAVAGDTKILINTTKISVKPAIVFGDALFVLTPTATVDIYSVSGAPHLRLVNNDPTVSLAHDGEIAFNGSNFIVRKGGADYKINLTAI